MSHRKLGSLEKEMSYIRCWDFSWWNYINYLLFVQILLTSKHSHLLNTAVLCGTVTKELGFYKLARTLSE